VELTFLIGLAEDRAEAALVFVVAGRGVDDESVRPVFTRIIHDRFRTESGAKFVEGAKSSRREGAAPPDCVLAGENIERRRIKRKISNVSSKKISKTKILSNLMNVSRGGGITDGGELIKARQNTFGGKPETKVSDVGRAKVTFFKV
jgi:hypothetical protein